MRARTLARHRTVHAASGWSHPYEAGIFSPVWYADGGDAGSSQDGDTGTEDKPDTGGTSTDSGSSDDGDGTDWKAEAEKYRALQKKWEARAKDNATAAKERDELRKQSMTDQEKAVEEASAKARAEERVRLSGRLARQGFLAAAAGRIPHAASVADDLNLARFVGEDGEIDEDGLAELVDRLAPKSAKSDKDSEEGAEKKAKQNGGRGFDQGPRGSGSHKESSLAAGRELYAQRKTTTSIT